MRSVSLSLRSKPMCFWSNLVPRYDTCRAVGETRIGLLGSGCLDWLHNSYCIGLAHNFAGNLLGYLSNHPGCCRILDNLAVSSGFLGDLASLLIHL